ncbi:multidrug effflux MFS transporter [Microbacterium sp. GXF7504]
MTGPARATDGGRAAGLTGTTLLGLSGLAMLGPMTTDAFLPALPRIAGEFEVTAGSVQLALSGVTIGLAVGQLFSGPLSDMFGRRRPLLIGSAALTLFAVAAALAPSLPLLIVSCAIIGLGAAAGATVGRAVVTDLETGPALTRGLSLLGSAMAVGPVIAPVFGVVLALLWGWRGIFVGLAVLALVSFVFVATLVPESLPPAHRIRGGLRAVPAAVLAAVRTRAFWCGALVVWFAFASSFAYISASPYVLQEAMGFPVALFAVVFAVNGLGVVAGGLVSARLARRWGPHRILGVGLTVVSLGAASVVVAIVTGTLTPWLVLPGFFLLAAACGLYIGPGLAMAVAELRETAGTTLALVGAVQFAISAAVAPIAVQGAPRDFTALAVTLVAGAVLAWIGWALFRPARPADS